MKSRWLNALWVGVACCAASALLASLLPWRGELTLHVAAHDLTLREPRWLLGLSLLPVFAWLRVGSRHRAGATQRVLRCAVFGSALLALSRPVAAEPGTVHATVLAVDVSDSIEASFLEQARRRIARLCRERGSVQLSLLTFARTAHRRELDCKGAPELPRHDDGSQSDIASALSLALGLLGPTHVGQVVLFSDGIETRGNSARAVEAARARGVRVFFETPSRVEQPELGVLALSLPSVVKAGALFSVDATLFSTERTRATVRLLRDGKPEPGQESAPVEIPEGESALSWRSRAPLPGTAVYRVELTPEGEDRLDANNHAERALYVLGKPRVLVVERERTRAGPLRALLEAAGFEVEVRGPEGAPQSAAALSRYDFYILSDVAHPALPANATVAIERFMQEGGGFLMAGGEQGFGLGGYRESRLARVLPIDMAQKQSHEEPSLALSLVIDKSGSMSDEKISLAKEAARATAALLHDDDYLGVIGFDSAPTHVVRTAAVRNRSAIERGIDRLKPGGGTAIFPALDAAYAELSGVRAKKKHVILLTDGQTREAGLDVLVQNMQLSDITLSTVGLGEDVSRKLLEELAQLGHGRAYFTNDPRHVPRLFLHDTESVSRSAVVEQPVSVRVAAPAAFLKGVPMHQAPALRGYVKSRARAVPAQVVLETTEGDPLLARVRVGLGWSLAFTSDLKPRWAASWFQWPSFSTLVAQLVREHMRPLPESSLAVQGRTESSELVAEVDVVTEQLRFVNNLGGSLTATPVGASEPLAEAALTLVAPGLYQARFPLPPLGSYTLQATLSAPGKEARKAFGTFGNTLPDEYRALAPAASALAAMTAATAGGELPPLSQLFAQRPGPPTEKPVWSYLVWACLLGYLAELAVRRLAARQSAANEGAGAARNPPSLRGK